MRDAASSADYTPRFEDQSGSAVTFYVMEGDEGLQIHSAKVTDCSFGFWGKEVTYKLDYVHPTPESCVERPLLEVADELKAAGVGFVLKHAKSGMDMTSSYEYGDFDEADMVITKAEKKFGSGNGSTSAEEFTLTIISQADRDADAAKRAVRETLEGKLGLFSAWWAVEDYGKWQYGDDFELHWQTDPLAQEAEDESTWFLKAYCTCYGERLNCEARVTGTSDDPQVIYFAVY